MDTIRESEIGLARDLPGTLRENLPQTKGYRPRVEIHENGRKKRRDASLRNWNPGAGKIVIYFDGADVGQITVKDATGSEQEGADKKVTLAPIPDLQGATEQTVPDSHFGDFIKSLNGAERRPGFDFVALKWFRDLYLTAEGYEWTGSLETRDKVLRTADENKIVFTYKVPNPKTPAFPVTALRLNRQHPEVVAVLGDNVIADTEFQPIELPGETLSRTVLDERR